MADKTTLKNWYRTGLKPLQAHFYAWMDSYWHKDEKIPITVIADIEAILDAKADAEALTGHFADAEAHGELFAKVRIIPAGELLVFKTEPNEDTATLEVGDFCMGIVEGEFIQANYTGDDTALLSSFDL